MTRKYGNRVHVRVDDVTAVQVGDYIEYWRFGGKRDARVASVHRGYVRTARVTYGRHVIAIPHRVQLEAVTSVWRKRSGGSR